MDGQRQTPATLCRGRESATNRTGGWVGPRATGAKNVAPTGTRYLDPSARSKSLYRLRYRGVVVENRYSL